MARNNKKKDKRNLLWLLLLALLGYAGYRVYKKKKEDEIVIEVTFYPDASPETTSVDGDVAHTEIPGVDWAVLVAAAGSQSLNQVGAEIGRASCRERV